MWRAVDSHVATARPWLCKRASSAESRSSASVCSMTNRVAAPVTTTSTRNSPSSLVRSELRIALRAISKAVHGLDHICGGTEADAQAAHVNVDGARVDVAAHLPHLLEQLFAREHAAGIADEQLQELVLERAQLGRRAVDADVVRHGIEL